MAVNIHSKIYSVIKKEGQPAGRRKSVEMSKPFTVKKLDLKQVAIFICAFINKKERTRLETNIILGFVRLVQFFRSPKLKGPSKTRLYDEQNQ
jgi:hypothetical protein